MAKAGRKPTEVQAKQIEAVETFFALPVELRPQSLKQWCEMVGIEVRPEVYQIAKDPKTVRGALKVMGLDVLKEIPTVLKSLVDGAKAGNVRAADVLLKHVLVLLGEGSENGEETRPLHRLIEDTEAVALRLNKLADSLDRSGQLRKLNSLRQKDLANTIDADFKEVKTSESAKSAYDQALDSVGADLTMK